MLRAAPAMVKDAKITVRIEGALLLKLDDIRRNEPGVPGRAEMIRRLIARVEIAPAPGKKKAKP